MTVLDVTDPTRPNVVSQFATREGISIHNVQVVDGIAYISYYLDGLRVRRPPRSGYAGRNRPFRYCAPMPTKGV